MTTLLEKTPLPDFVHGEVVIDENQGFKIDDEGKAAWAAGKILAARRRIRNRGDMADAYQNRILDWLSTANQRDEQTVSFLENSLRPWAEEAISHLGKVRSIRLPGARVGLRKKPERVEVVDVELALAFCAEHELQNVVIVKKELGKSELKKHLAQGARIPGTLLIPGEDEMTVSED